MVEMVISLFLFFTISCGVIAVFATGARAQKAAESKSRQGLLADSKMEELMGMPVAALVSTAAPISYPVPNEPFSYSVEVTPYVADPTNLKVVTVTIHHPFQPPKRLSALRSDVAAAPSPTPTPGVTPTVTPSATATPPIVDPLGNVCHTSVVPGASAGGSCPLDQRRLEAWLLEQ